MCAQPKRSTTSPCRSLAAFGALHDGMASAAAPCRRNSGTRTLIAADAENGTIAVAFAATEAYILGGFLAATLYDTVGAG